LHGVERVDGLTQAVGRLFIKKAACGQREHPRRPARHCSHGAQSQVPALWAAYLWQVWPAVRGEWQSNREYKGWTWGIVDVPVERFFGPAEKINITVPGRLLKHIDDHARAHGETRSGFLTKAAIEAMRGA
jgi:hypothetical protein